MTAGQFLSHMWIRDLDWQPTKKHIFYNILLFWKGYFDFLLPSKFDFQGSI